jgi:hypothetical protein
MIWPLAMSAHARISWQAHGNHRQIGTTKVIGSRFNLFDLLDEIIELKPW